MTKIGNSSFFTFIRHHWLTVAFLLGFVTDYLLLNQIDNKFDNFVLFFYFILATVSIIFFYIGVAEKAPVSIVRLFNWLTPISMQYSFGGLLSGMLIFYGRSGDLIVSAPFLLLIIGVILANELIKKRSDRLFYNLIVYFIGTFSYLVLEVPVLIGEMGDLIFVTSGLVSLLVMYLLLRVLALIIPNYLALEKKLIVFTIGCLYVLFNGLYFFNYIPPIPLSLTELSIFQHVERTSVGGYRITKTTDAWKQKVPFISFNFRPIKDQGAFCFARVYAPTSLTTDIVHRWQYKNTIGIWEDYFTYSYNITGDNKLGYRGFTTINNLKAGLWRCSVETTRGQVLGRKTFTVNNFSQPQNLVTVVE